MKISSVHTEKSFNLLFKIPGRNSRYAASRGASIQHSSRLQRTTDYATVLLPLPGISNDLEVVRLLYVL